jgi:predicted DNA helicase
MAQRKLLVLEAKRMKSEADLLERYIIENILEKSAVISSTLVGAYSPYLEGRYFSTVFIDEASQALEPASWIPIIKSHRVIFAGDHMQLPPTVKSLEAAEAGLSVTLFEKGIKRNTTDYMLSVQYRMNEKIMGFSNQVFYGNRLLADRSVASWKIADNDEPVILIDTAGCGLEEYKDPESQSTSNRGEAEILLNYLRRYLIDYEPWLKGSDFGIITPYRAQVEMIKKLIIEMNDPVFPDQRITVNTVDAFQGQERDVILISLVRSNPIGEIGFLRDTRRMNVALTRARKKLIIIGDTATIGNDPFYGRLTEYILGINAYKSAFELND